MRDKELDRMITEAYQNHQLVIPMPSKNWTIRGERPGEYWFNVTWTKGHLALSGDVGELTLTHYHALPTWVRAVDWVHESDVHYLLGKSNAKREYNHEASVERLVRMADGLLESGDDSMWRKIFSTMFPQSWGGGVLSGYRYWTPEEWKAERRFHNNPDGIQLVSVDSESDRALVTKSLREDIDHLSLEFDPYDLYGDWDCIAETWHAGDFWQARAILKWAALVRETEEYRVEKEREEAVEAA